MSGAESGPTVIADVRTPGGAGAAMRVVLRDGLIEAVESDRASGDVARGRTREEVECSGAHLLPGWIDLQVNDIGWLSGGLRPAEAHRARIRQVLAHQVARGATGLLLATLAAPEEEVLAYLEGAASLRSAPEPVDEALLGVLVEGTFMNPAFSGAHNPAYVRAPDRRLLERLLGTGAVRAVNVAPETGPEALDLIAAARKAGALVGVGHAKPSGERVREAVEAGLSYVIHLGNGPTGSSLKGFFEGGLFEETLRNDRLIATLILDGVHLDRRLVRDIIARKGLEGVVGVSDAGFATGAPSGRFSCYGIEGEASPDGRYLRVVPPRGAPPPNPLSSDAGALFGSTAHIKDVFENALNWLSVEMEGIYHRRHPALAFEQALSGAVALTAGNPARLIGDKGRGAVEPGRRADLVLASIEGGPGAYRVQPKAVWLGGRQVV